jgi:hypothetical protein
MDGTPLQMRLSARQMSRAFVRESDQQGEALAQRLVSAHLNLVTPAGLKQIAVQVAELEVTRQAARVAHDKPLLERVNRDRRYSAQRATSRAGDRAGRGSGLGALRARHAACVAARGRG